MNKPTVIIKNISKKYYFEKPKTIKNWVNNFMSPFDKFIVIDNFSLTVEKGKFIVITGPNGCGKTTLLRLMSGITEPDHGSITMNGRVVPLIDLGAGFNSELTGRENAMINATILGIKKRDILEILPKVIDFSELNSFIDIPLKRYSTGMIARLAFSIAVYAQPDILLLDEVFAIGDERFQKKSLDKLHQLKRIGVTIILVSHYYQWIDQIDRIVRLPKNSRLKG